MLLVQKWPFFQLFFLGNIGQENVFFNILERKNAFLGYKNKKFKRSKNWHFSKRVNPWFWSKDGHFPTFFFCAIWASKKFLLYSKAKKRLSRLWKFFQSGYLMVWVQKRQFFPLFFFRQYRPEQCLLRYSRAKKRLFKL